MSRIFDKMEEVVVWTNAYSTDDIGKHLARLRGARGLHQDELADRLGVSRATISSMENGGAVSVQLVVRAMSVLGSRVVIAPKDATVIVTEA